MLTYNISQLFELLECFNLHHSLSKRFTNSGYNVTTLKSGVYAIQKCN